MAQNNIKVGGVRVDKIVDRLKVEIGSPEPRISKTFKLKPEVVTACETAVKRGYSLNTIVEVGTQILDHVFHELRKPEKLKSNIKEFKKVGG